MRLRSMGHATGRLAHAALQPVRRAVLAQPVTAMGFRIATSTALAWGKLLGGEVQTVGDLHVVTGLPSWAFGRGGTTVGATFLTNANISVAILAHEEVHRQQWLRYGLAFIPLYYAAGIEGTSNRFEIEAGLEAGGYVPKSTRGGRRTPKAS